MRLEDRTFYCIYNPGTGAFRASYGTSMPALYNTYGQADGILRQLKKRGTFTKYEVAGVNLHMEIDWT